MGRTWQQVKDLGEDSFPPAVPPPGALAASHSFAGTARRDSDTRLPRTWADLGWCHLLLDVTTSFIGLLSDPLNETLGSRKDSFQGHIPTGRNSAWYIVGARKHLLHGCHRQLAYPPRKNK